MKQPVKAFWPKFKPTRADLREHFSNAAGFLGRRIAGRAWNGEFRRTTRFVRKPFTAFGLPCF
jgi:hypothetical protein